MDEKRPMNITGDGFKAYSMKPVPNLHTARAIRTHPLNVVERLAIADHLDYERYEDDEIHLSLPGRRCEHDVSIVWNTKLQQIELYLLIESRVLCGHKQEICRLISLLNERTSAGHFDFWRTKSAFVYRNSLNLAGGAALNIEQAMALIAGALEAAERGYPACQYLIWAGKSPEEALDNALLDLAAHEVQGGL